jgi:transposase
LGSPASWGLGLTTRRYQSGEVDYEATSRGRGDAHVRGLLYKAATVMLTRTHAECGLRAWGLRLKGKLGVKRAAVAVARKLAVILHAMLVSDQRFDHLAGLAAADG